MMMMKLYKILTLTFVLMFLITPNLYAEIRVFTKTVREAINGSLDEAKTLAIERAKRESLEQTGVYLEALTVVKANNNKELTKDDILILTAGITKVDIISQKYDKTAVEMVLKITVDTAILDERVKKMLNDKSLQRKYEEAEKDRRAKTIRNKELEDKLLAMENDKDDFRRSILIREKMLRNKRLEATERELEGDIRQARAYIDDYRSVSNASENSNHTYR
jgi:hypothetical protein